VTILPQDSLLDVRDLQVSLRQKRRRVQILDHVSFDLRRDEIVGLVGESGSGKTLTSLAIMGFLPATSKVDAGEIRFKGRELLALEPAELQRIRGNQIAMIYQSSRSALNPLMRAGDQVARVFQIQQGMASSQAYTEAVKLLKLVGFPDAETRARAYPHQLSGGMAQRVLLAMMVACQPTLLIADEPTTGLDVTIQAQIFELLKDVQQASSATILLITHDLGVVAEVCQRVVVMYAGQVMEIAPVSALFSRPLHPYTRMLLATILRADRLVEMPKTEQTPVEAITYSIAGCRFAPRCPVVLPRCWEQRPAPEAIDPDHIVLCHNFRDGADSSR
jgi:oligopeptide/dipeptide ABC transporter ATP-binding protein